MVVKTRRIRRVRRRVSGRGFFDDFLGGVRNVAGTIGSVGQSLMPLAPLLLGAGIRRRRVVRRRRTTVRPRTVGRGFMDSLKRLATKAHSHIKKHSLVSKGLDHFGYNRLANSARALGYGRRRRVAKRTTRRR